MRLGNEGNSNKYIQGIERHISILEAESFDLLK